MSLTKVIDVAVQKIGERNVKIRVNFASPLSKQEAIDYSHNEEGVIVRELIKVKPPTTASCGDFFSIKIFEI